MFLKNLLKKCGSVDKEGFCVLNNWRGLLCVRLNNGQMVLKLCKYHLKLFEASFSDFKFLTRLGFNLNFAIEKKDL